MDRRHFFHGCLALGATPALFAGADHSTVAELSRVRAGWLKLLGPFPTRKPALDARMRQVAETADHVRHQVSFASEGNDRVTAWLLLPKTPKKNPGMGVIAIHPTTGGTGKDRSAGLAGLYPGEKGNPADLSRAYGLELVRRGHVVLCIDLLTDGERVAPGLGPYDSRAFYQRHPDWSMVGKNTWDIMRSVDFLLTRPEVDARRIACVGHSLGGHSSLFAAALDPRIGGCVANGGVLGWMRPADHWARAGGMSPPPAPGEKPPAGVGRYTYIKNAGPYLADATRAFPVDFSDLMLLVAPRPLWVGESQEEARDYGLEAMVSRVRQAYLGATPRHAAWPLFDTATYPGGHGFPDDARTHAWGWLETWV